MKKSLLFVLLNIICFSLIAQNSDSSGTEPAGELQINGSVDVYYRYNFANARSAGALNNATSFTNSQNSIELGMASLKASYTKGKAGVVVDLGFGTRAREFSYAEEPDGEGNGSAVLQTIKQAYVVYNPTDNIRISAGKWGTHLGYEVLDPQLNRNYSMGYMFSYGPFSHTGLKADINLGNGFGVMAGIANPTDYLGASFAKKNFIAQFSKTGETVNAYLNYVSGKDIDNTVNGNQVGLTATAKVSDMFSLGYDGTVKFIDPNEGGSGKWWGSALYLNLDPSEKFGITLRGEYFDDKDKGFVFGTFDEVNPRGTSVTQATLSFNIKPVSGLAIIPEFRIDSAKDAIFTKNDGSSTKSTSTFLVAAVYSF